MESLILKNLAAAQQADRESWLIEYLSGNFKRLLLLDNEEELPTDQNYFDYGLTSLGVEELKQVIEDELGRAISPAVLFNNPTVDHLARHIKEDLLPEYFNSSEKDEEGYKVHLSDISVDGDGRSKREVLDRILDSLYQ